MNISIAEWASFTQLIQDLIAGTIGRHTFSQPEMELLFDVESARLRKSARPEVLRRYLKFVQTKQTQGAASPPRLSVFIAQGGPECATAKSGG